MEGIYIKYDGAEQDEHHRHDRLAQFLGTVAARYPKLLKQIKGVHDHKGELTIEYNSYPVIDCLRLNSIWNDMAEYEVVHVFDDRIVIKCSGDTIII